MRSIRIYHPEPLKCGDHVILSSFASHHLLNVLRIKIGTAIILFNGHGGQFDAEITAIKKQQISATVGKFSDNNIESPLTLILGQAIAKGERMDWVIQKAVELGVATIVPLITQHCTIKLDKQRQQKRLLHWQRIIISACEQCGRNYLPNIDAPITLAEWLHNLPEPSHKLILDPTSDQPLSHPFNIQTNNEPIIVLIGPEGGFSDEEITLAKNVSFTPVKAGPRILRTETAAISALAIMQTLYGDL